MTLGWNTSKSHRRFHPGVSFELSLWKQHFFRNKLAKFILKYFSRVVEVSNNLKFWTKTWVFSTHYVGAWHKCPPEQCAKYNWRNPNLWLCPWCVLVRINVGRLPESAVASILPVRRLQPEHRRAGSSPPSGTTASPPPPRAPPRLLPKWRRASILLACAASLAWEAPCLLPKHRHCESSLSATAADPPPYLSIWSFLHLILYCNSII